MKFSQRIAFLIVGLLLALIGYFTLPRLIGKEDRYYQKNPGGFDPRIKQEWRVDLDEAMCKTTGSGIPHGDFISTDELYASTEFDAFDAEGLWQLPDMQEAKDKANLPRLKVILMPHSHNDPGWLKTVNEYYLDESRHILNNMVNKLTEYPDMTFVWAETIFLSMWWNELDDSVKAHVRRLVRRGQLEIVSGGWVMPDEAVTHYVSVIDQLVEGHQWLLENLGVRPVNSWSIDPFGVSGILPYLWHEAGMKHMVVNRIHHAVKASLIKHKALDFYWRQAWDQMAKPELEKIDEDVEVVKISEKVTAPAGLTSTNILCHIMLYDLYSIKHTCGPDRDICITFDFQRTNINVEEEARHGEEITSEIVGRMARILASQYRSKASNFKHNVLLMPLGDDFRYVKEVEWDQQFKNYEKLKNYMNSDSELNLDVRWGTLKDYFRLLNEELETDKLSLPAISGDFFPYSDRERDYWTGFYTTRPFDKYFSRDLQALLQAADVMVSISYAFFKKWGLTEVSHSKFFHFSSILKEARRWLGLFQHHDAITGTSKDFVVEDYEENLLTAYTKCQVVISSSIQGLLSKGQVNTPIVFHPVVIRSDRKTLPKNHILPISSPGTNVALYNPLGQFRRELIVLLVDTPYVQIIAAGTEELLTSQISPAWSMEDGEVILKDKVFELTFELTFSPFAVISVVLKRLPSKVSGFEGFQVHLAKIKAFNFNQFTFPRFFLFPHHIVENNQHEDIVVSNGVIQLIIDPLSGSLLTLKNLRSGHTIDLYSSFQFYKVGHSGAYLFSPEGEARLLFPSSDKDAKPLYPSVPTIRISEGKFVTTIEITFVPVISQRITIYSQPAHLAGAVFIENILSAHILRDKEIIMRFNTNVRNTELSFFTDQNGYQFIHRQTQRKLPIAANYYPMTSGAILEDANARLTLLSAQPHGCAVLEEGQLEIMLDRQLSDDDFRGLGEGVEDIKTTLSRFVILSEERGFGEELKPTSPPLLAALSLPALILQDALHQPILKYFTTVDSDVFFRAVTPMVKSALPCDITSVSLHSLPNIDLEYNGTSLILHRRGYDCRFKTISDPAPSAFCDPSDPELSIASLFEAFEVSKLREMSLTSTIEKQSLDPSGKLNLKPMQLSTFHFHF